MNPPCGHTDEQAEALRGLPWDDRGGWSPMCRVCWRWANDLKAREGWSRSPSSPAARAFPALPLEKWPKYALYLHARRRPGERGVGDTAHRMIGPKRSALFKKVFKWITGNDCGCSDRHGRLNLAYPYPQEGPQVPS